MDTADRWLKHYLSADDDPAEIWRFASAIRALVEKTEHAGLLKVDGAPLLRVNWAIGGRDGPERA